MQIVETTIRPVRLALACSTDASNRVLRRAFRLVGGRWGGYFDIVLRCSPAGRLDPFWTNVMKAADPDLVLIIDPKVSVAKLASTLERAGLQPFAVERLKEGAERRTPHRLIFRETPTRAPDIDPDDTSQADEVLDLECGSATWREIARLGLPHPTTEATRQRRAADARLPLDERAPVMRGRVGITAEGAASARWLLIGGADDPELACRYWSLRALGAAPTWRVLRGADLGRRPALLARSFVISAPGVDVDLVSRTAAEWSTQRKSFRAESASDVAAIPYRRYHLASQVEAVVPFDGFLRVSLPAPPPLEHEYAATARGAVEFNLLSATPGAPDGMILVPNDCSRELVARGHPERETRVTRRGFAQLQPLTAAALVAVPEITYRQAVTAAFEQHRFRLTPSDKGLYQQRSLQLAGGLQFLAWMLRQPSSRHLLNMFFEYHLAGSPPEGYRRAVRYDELRNRLLAQVKASRGGRSLRASVRDRAEAWLADWADGLLERELLEGGHVLRCPECAYRSFYRLDDLGQRFRCRRCVADSPLPGDVERCFRLNEAAYQLLVHDGDVTVLTLATLRDRALQSLLYLPEIISKRDGVVRELDIAALVDGELVVGEVKSNDKLAAKEVRNSRFVVRNARASRMLFATTSKAQDECAAGDCASCIARHGEHHADNAWSTGAREQVEETRSNLAGEGIKVESLCWYSLVGSHADARQELRPFER